MRSPNSIDQHIGQRIRARRAILNLTQADLANALGVSYQQIQKYEKGLDAIGVSRLPKVAETLKVSMAYLFEGLDKAPMPQMDSSPADFLASSADCLILAKAFMKLRKA